MDTKTCNVCMEDLPISNFYKRSDRGEYRYECKGCHSARYRHKWATNPTYRKAGKERSWAHSLKRNYGITPEDYRNMLSSQAGVCKICGVVCKSGNRLCVDHCHKTGVVRGLLCDQCNKGLGNFMDNVESLKAAIRYLEGK